MNKEYRIQDIEYPIPSTSLGSRLASNELRISVFCVLSSVFCLLSVAGCNNPNKDSLVEQVEQLNEQKTQLQKQVEQSRAENIQLKKQVRVLSGIPEEVKFDNLSRLQRVKIGRLSGFFDKDRDGKIEKLIVYVQPVDEQGDAVKASGAVNVQLWDLNKADGQALLGEWNVTPGDMKNFWYKTIITANYRLIFDIPDKVESLQEPLTIRATFTDYMTGKVFKEQKVIKP